MIGQAFSRDAFASAAHDDRVRLLKDLAVEIDRRVTSEVRSEIVRIVAHLNALGHHLDEFEDPTAISFEDVDPMSDSSQWRLRMSMTHLVWAAYGDVIVPRERQT
jgi:hypothetical protein